MARWVGPAAWGYVVLAAGAAGVVWGWGDRSWIGTTALFGPRWLVLLPLAGLLPAALLLRRRALAPLLLGAVIAVGPVMGLRLGWRSWLPGGEASLRVATLNAEGNPAALVALLPLLDRWGTEIAAIQECGIWAPAILQFRPEWNVHHDGSQCLLSRFPIEAAEPVRWEELDAARSSGLGGSGVVVRYRVRTPERVLHLANLHLETPRKGLESLRYAGEVAPVAGNTILREIGSRRASEAVGPDRASTIVLGDFNMPVESAIYRASWGDFQNAFSRAGRGFGMTKDNGWIRARIDHVLAGSAWRPVRAWAGPFVGSDHWPVFAELRWAGE